MSERRCPKCERETTRAEPAYRVKELEAKLAEAARIHVESETKHAYRVKELEAKLAGVGETAIAWHALAKELQDKLNDHKDCASLLQWQRERERAEAAEARVRELEAKDKVW